MTSDSALFVPANYHTCKLDLYNPQKLKTLPVLRDINSNNGPISVEPENLFLVHCLGSVSSLRLFILERHLSS